ncbi:type II toxin-antitoxin system VapC family toxin [Methylovulum psychrotolerans]|uniref:VapC toxin family PIN domain ribonuclease n=1 Tax=Methylovulum psychrotolerans TaxID=1704499 RepID=A0A1Z4BWQ2_9GAMM|nr:PIN domain-containing protein [Methylovulum psychrotolerans]ASF45663.1 VapC toxin family PIN domain ribonuclease [Methylovulum psychrotolerans]
MIIADTGFWLALGDKNDKHHLQADSFAKTSREKLVSTYPVMTEVCHLLLKRQGITAQLKFITMYQFGAFDVFDIPTQDKSRILSLMRQYADLPMDLADASLVLLAEHLGHGRILSTDKRDFQTYRWKNTQPFTNLLC